MKLCGWNTRAMFDRYNIIDRADLFRAVVPRISSAETNNCIEAADKVPGCAQVG